MSSLVASIGELTDLDIRLPKEAWEGTYSYVEVWRSFVGEKGPYEEVTGPGYAPAILPQDAPEPPSPPEIGRGLPLTGTTLTLEIGVTPLTVQFTGGDPITLALAATQIQLQSGGRLRAYAYGVNCAIATVETGTAARLVVTGGDAAPLLGLPIGVVARGRVPRLLLLPDQERYTLRDYWGSSSAWYRTRLRTRSGSTSSWSLPVHATHKLSTDNLVRGFVRLVDLSARPVQNREVCIAQEFTAQPIGDSLVTGSTLSATTDADGLAEFFLVRGARVTVAITGTSVIREITVPVDPGVFSFNLFEGLVGESDAFRVRTPEQDFAARRSL